MKIMLSFTVFPKAPLKDYLTAAAMTPFPLAAIRRTLLQGIARGIITLKEAFVEPLMP